MATKNIMLSYIYYIIIWLRQFPMVMESYITGYMIYV